MTDERAIEIAKRSGYGPVVKMRAGGIVETYVIITVNLAAKPPTVTRTSDAIPLHMQRIENPK